MKMALALGVTNIENRRFDLFNVAFLIFYEFYVLWNLSCIDVSYFTRGYLKVKPEENC